MSEMAWILQAHEYPYTPKTRISSERRRGTSDLGPSTATEFAYFIDETNVWAADEDLVDEWRWPTLEVALLLSEAYFHALQGAFQSLVREIFPEALLAFPRDKAMLSWAERRWLALANLVWATAPQWLHIAHLAGLEHSEDHLIYYARARALGLDHRILIGHHDVERVQAIGLLAFYLLANSSITWQGAIGSPGYLCIPDIIIELGTS
jgi:hypothetical protein